MKNMEDRVDEGLLPIKWDEAKGRKLTSGPP